LIAGILNPFINTNQFSAPGDVTVLLMLAPTLNYLRLVEHGVQNPGVRTYFKKL
jgi:hypothetical protein